MNSNNTFLNNAIYSQPKSTSLDILEKIRSTKRVEPENTGLNHPTNIYIPLGHGQEIFEYKAVVPKGCILVVKSHSGDTRMSGDVINNARELLDTRNKEIVFDPVSHKKELFSLLDSNNQASYKDISASSSTAIYREGDTYNNFVYKLVSGFPPRFPNLIRPSGIFALEYTSPSIDLNYLDKYNDIESTTKVFVKDSSDNYMYNPYIIELDIPSFFSESNIYPYYYTKQHIQDMLDVILAYTNLHKDGYLNMAEAEKKLIEMLGKKYLNIKKNYTYGRDPYIESFLYTINESAIAKECLKSVPNEEIHKFKALHNFQAIENKNRKNDPRNKWIECLREITLDKIFIIILSMTTITQLELFMDVENGTIKPGIFYNLICRETQNTLHTNPSTNNASLARVSGLLNTKYIENSNHTIKVHNQAGEIKNRISEAVLQRKNQARQVFNNGKYGNNTGRKYKKNNGKWVENVPATGGKRKTRKQKTTKRKTRKHR